MNIDRILVAGLFHEYDYEIDLTREGPITIIYGPNGAGKSTILRATDAVFNDRLEYLVSFPFGRFTFELNDGTSLSVEQTADRLSDSWTEEGDEVSNWKVSVSGRLNQGNKQAWNIPLITAEISASRPVERLYRRYMPPSVEHVGREAKQEYKSLIESIRVKFVSTARLSSDGGANRLEQLNKQMVIAIKEAREEYLAEVNRSSRWFVRVLIDRMSDEDSTAPDLESLEARYHELIMSRGELAQIGLLDASDTFAGPGLDSLGDMPDAARTVLGLWLDVEQARLSVFTDRFPTLYKRLKLLREILEAFYLGEFPFVRFDRDTGLDVTKNPLRSIGESPVSPFGLTHNGLSSGEQHLFVMMYEMLFKSRPGSLLLIDEPEISLHIRWQQMFIDTLASIANMCDYRAIVSTHSPSIIYDKWDLTVDLDPFHRTAEGDSDD